MPKKHNRRSIRLRGFDYASTGAYYVTLNVKYRTPLFGTLRDGVMHLSPIGQIVQEEWLRTPDIRPEVVLDEFIIMPDHMHMIVWIRDVGPLNGGRVQRAPTVDATISNVGADGIRPIENDGGACHDTRARATRPDNVPRHNDVHRTRPLGNIIRGFKGSVTHRIQNENVGATKDAMTSNVGADRIRPHEIELGACNAPRHFDLRHESIWQRNYYERIVRDERELRTFRDYIIENPIKG